MKKLSYDTYRKKLNGCFMGKVIGGTVGMPFEGKRSTRNISFYEPVPTEMVANDDLDLQVVWLESIRQYGLPINRRHLCDAWVKHIHYAFDEYGMALRNIKSGVYAPLSGQFNNVFYSGMGSAIRTEIWAAAAPCNPELAVHFATEDACVDHTKDGLYASRFIAAIESKAFETGDFDLLIKTGLSFIPDDTRLSNGIKDTIKWWNESGDMLAVREKFLKKYEVVNWTDVTINLSFIVLAWLAGNGDFGKCICAASNLGFDTDCTSGTLGAILGIINPDGIEEKWIKPIGNQLVLSDAIIGMHDISTIDVMCDKIVSLCRDVQNFYKTDLEIENMPNFYPQVPHWSENHEVIKNLIYDSGSAIIAVSPLVLELKYPENAVLTRSEPAEFVLNVYNSSSKALSGDILINAPDGWSVSNNNLKFDLSAENHAVLKFTLSASEFGYYPAFNEITFFVRTDDLLYQVTAGVPQALPWLKAERGFESDTCPEAEDFKNAKEVYSESFIQKVETGEFIFAIDFKLHNDFNVNLVPQGLPAKLWIDGEKLTEHDGKFYTPSAHRFECSVQKELKTGWHTAVIAAKNDTEGVKELFFAIGNMAGKTWLDQVEWRKTDFGKR